MFISLFRTDAQHPHFGSLVQQLDADLAIRDGDEHSFYAPFNKIDNIHHVILAYNEHNEPIGCGAIKPFGNDAMEIKRMWVVPTYRNRGIAQSILHGLEEWTKELGCTRCVLETGKKQGEALQLYPKCGFEMIPNYGQYMGKENSICFQKNLQ
jgi:putative acetyltransferase